MWHHYTNGNKGICLEYDTKDITDLLQIEKFFPVKYDDELIDMSYLMAHNEQPIYTPFELLAMTKLKDWQYEDVIRDYAEVANLSVVKAIITQYGLEFTQTYNLKAVCVWWYARID